MLHPTYLSSQPYIPVSNQFRLHPNFYRNHQQPEHAPSCTWCNTKLFCILFSSEKEPVCWQYMSLHNFRQRSQRRCNRTASLHLHLWKGYIDDENILELAANTPDKKFEQKQLERSTSAQNHAKKNNELLHNWTWIHKNFTAINRFYKFYHYTMMYTGYMHSIIYVHIKSVLDHFW